MAGVSSGALRPRSPGQGASPLDPHPKSCLDFGVMARLVTASFRVVLPRVAPAFMTRSRRFANRGHLGACGRGVLDWLQGEYRGRFHSPPPFTLRAQETSREADHLESGRRRFLARSRPSRGVTRCLEASRGHAPRFEPRGKKLPTSRPGVVDSDLEVGVEGREGHGSGRSRV